jgi:cytochrome c-type biogenesis protein CcmH/NrfF
MRPNCGHYDDQAKRLDQLLDQGMDHDAVVASFVREFGGQAVLTAPIDRGFNRLAWAFPYALGVATLGAVFIAARRWARPATTDSPETQPLDAAIDTRLDDELRNLD